MWTIILLILATSYLSQGFKIGEWVGKFCSEEKLLYRQWEPSFRCENFNFAEQELQEFQEGDFLVSVQRIIFIESGDIGVLDENFLKKFPNAEEFLFRNVKLHFDLSTESIDHPLVSIRFVNCEISGIKDTLFFQNLINMKDLELVDCQFDHPVLEKRLLGPSSELISLRIKRNSFEIKDDAFEGLLNLRILKLADDFENLSTLLSKLVLLEVLDLSRNNLTSIPCEAIPRSVKRLTLSHNQIHEPSLKGCKFAEDLIILDLKGNGIEDFDVSTIDLLKNTTKVILSD